MKHFNEKNIKTYGKSMIDEKEVNDYISNDSYDDLLDEGLDITFKDKKNE